MSVRRFQVDPHKLWVPIRVLRGKYQSGPAITSYRLRTMGWNWHTKPNEHGRRQVDEIFSIFIRN